MAPIAPEIACVALPALPLQILLRRHPEWRGEPVAVVAEDHPRGRIAWVNEGARRLGVLPGQRYGEALALATGLRAGVIAPGEVGAAVAAITRRLRRFTSGVEPAADEPGLFWLDATGLIPLHPSLAAWGEAIHTALVAAGLAATMAIGFTRFGTYAVARTGRGVRCLASPEEERMVVGALPLARLDLAPELRDALARLGVTTVAQLLALPAGGLLERFGPEAYRLHRLADDDLFSPLAPEPERLPVAAATLLDYPEVDAHRLVHHIDRLLAPLLDRLTGDQMAVAVLHLALHLDDGGRRHHRLRPALPTREPALLLELVRLRLAATPLPAGAVEVGLELEAVAAGREQIHLLAPRPHRDLRAAEHALARIRAELGEGAVGRFHLHDAHLPEAQFSFVPLGSLATPHPPPRGEGQLVRRFHHRPVTLTGPPLGPLRQPTPSPQPPPGGRGSMTPHLLAGPFTLTTGWWQDVVARDYYYATGCDGALLWLFYDRHRRQWLHHGWVE